jgi:hypothetical protein
VASRPVPPDSVAAESAPRHTDEPWGQPAAPSPYPPPWADPPAGAGRSQSPPGHGGNGYVHGPAVGVAIGSAAGLSAGTAHLPIVPGPRENDIERENDIVDEARRRDRNDRDVNDRDVDDCDVDDCDVEDRDWSDGDWGDNDRGDHHQKADGPLEYAPWVDEDPAPLPPGWRGL